MTPTPRLSEGLQSARVGLTIHGMASSTRIAPSPGTSLLEREDDLAVLHGAFSEVRAGRGRLALVAGEAGVADTVIVRPDPVPAES